MHQGSTLPGVTVTLVKPDGSKIVAVTDASGRYRFMNVAPGDYIVTTELEGFDRRNERVKVGASGKELKTELRPGVAAEAITVTAASPTVSRAAMKVSADFVVGGVVGGVIGSHVGGAPMSMPPSDPQYASIAENQFIEAAKQQTTTFAIDVDRASYTNVRRFLSMNMVPPPGAVRVEEMLNYFTYSYPQPQGREPFSITTETASCPWNPKTRLLRIGIQGRNLDEWKMAPNNLVFLLDVSGSMSPPERLPLIKSAFRVLVDRLRAEDRVAIVVYAGAAGLVLPSTSGADKATILAALDRLNAGGSTAGAAGIQLAYDTAQQSLIADGNNRVILATDGDFNIGVSDNETLLKMIEEKRKLGVALTTIGVGTDNYHDARMEMLADHGNGAYFYLDNISEATKVFKQELTGTLVTIAKDVKVQMEFNPAVVKSYRQVGYENRALANKDFEDDTKDAGELGAGHSVTALYEVELTRPGRIATLRLRYKQPNGSASELLTTTIEDSGRSIYQASSDLQFAAAVAEFGMLLRKSQYAGTASFQDVMTLARAANTDATREEFLRLVDASRALTGEAPPAIGGQ